MSFNQIEILMNNQCSNNLYGSGNVVQD